MTRTQKLQLEQSENRQAIGKALDTEIEKRSDTFTADLETLTKRATALETELQAAILASDNVEVEVETREAPEDRELADLIERADIGHVFDAAITGRLPDGAEAELQQHFNLQGNQVPLALLHRADADDLELRTAGVTPAPATGNVGTTQAAIVPYVFPQSSVSYLRIPQPTVPVGESVYTVLATAASPGTPAKGADQAHSTGAFAANVLSPGRIQSSLFFAREDAARLRGMGEALRQNLSDALADELDQQVVGGSAGLVAGSTLTNVDTSTADTFATYLSRLAYDRVDGRFAATAADLRLLVGSATYADMAGSYRATASGMQALAELVAATGGVRVSANIPAVVSTKQPAIVRRGSRMDAVIPVWDGVTIIRDEVTQAKAGEVILTAVMLYAFKVLRGDGFAKVATKHA